jgi:enoyl-CoA hydratase
VTKLVTPDPEIIFTEIPGNMGKLGVITLNRPKALNALNQTMIFGISKALEKWAIDPEIKAVILRAVEGRAFCAGGDIRAVYQRGLAKDPTIPNFFVEEYNLNKQIYHFPKPYIVFLDGITMGGGAGISIHGSHKVATKNMVFAMPETGIGFFPDVGVSYYLARMPEKIGFYLGLTGERLLYSDCLELGVVDYIVEPENFTTIIEKLLAAPLKHEAEVSEILKHFALHPAKTILLEHQAEIKNCFAKNNMEEILQALMRYPTAWSEQTAAIIATKSPTSLKVTLQQIQNSVRLTFDDCIKQDYHLMTHFLQAPDVFEGVRALLIDKDQKPRWQPDKLDEISATTVLNYFKPLS